MKNLSLNFQKSFHEIIALILIKSTFEESPKGKIA